MLAIDRKHWHNSYMKYLKEMYYITLDILKEHFPKLNIKNHNMFFNIFSKLIYNSSSKYISPYL